MRATRPLLCAALTLAAVVAVATPAAAAATANSSAAPTPPGQDKAGHYSFAIIGDVPYGSAQQALFPQWIQEINAAQPALTFHVGDIKNGSSRCDDALYEQIKGDFDTFVNPLIYTPGDNEWTDCHRVNNGAYNPLERLAYDRSVFFSTPGQSLGQNPVALDSQAAAGFPENVSLRRQGVDFATIHVVGSNDGAQPWTGLGESRRLSTARSTSSTAIATSTTPTSRSPRDPPGCRHTALLGRPITSPA